MEENMRRRVALLVRETPGMPREYNRALDEISRLRQIELSAALTPEAPPTREPPLPYDRELEGRAAVAFQKLLDKEAAASKRGVVFSWQDTHELVEAIGYLAGRSSNGAISITDGQRAALTPEAPPTRELEMRERLIAEVGRFIEERESKETLKGSGSRLVDRIAALYRGESDGGAARAVAIATENRDASLAAGNVQAAYVGEAIRRELADLFIDGFAMGQVAPLADLKQEREDFLTRPENPFLPSVREASTRMVAAPLAPSGEPSDREKRLTEILLAHRICPKCGHVKEFHQKDGCHFQLDSAWTPMNTRPCGCSYWSAGAATPQQESEPETSNRGHRLAQEG